MPSIDALAAPTASLHEQRVASFMTGLKKDAAFVMRVVSKLYEWPRVNEQPGLHHLCCHLIQRFLRRDGPDNETLDARQPNGTMQ